ncbi:MAG: hypothetical protein QXV32_00400 [Conexivisphaerales archaeon]
MAYIISPSLSIDVINSILARICAEFSGTSDGPLPEPAELLKMKRPSNNFLGKKWYYLLGLAKKVYSGEFDFRLLEDLPYDVAWRKLVVEEPHFLGIGPKVADCILLFSAGKYSSFPIDRWVLRGLKMHYSFLTQGVNSSSDVLSVKKYAKVSGAARSYFGEYAGFLQEYLFMHLRSGS